jgi:hypothetical protein
MKIDERCYPHPVLSHFSDDLGDSNFQVTPKVTIAKTVYSIEITSKTSNKDLRTMVAEGKATYGIHVECATTRFRKLYTSKEERFDIEILADDLNGGVEICTLIIAAVDIPNYKNSATHPDYGDISFPVRKGDVLAVSYGSHFNAEKDIDPLQNVSSIFKVSEKQGETKNSFELDLMNNYVSILLSKKNFNAYGQLQKLENYHATLASMIITPALVFILEEMRKDGAEDDYKDCRWYKVIKIKIKNKGYKNSEEDDIGSLDLAQLLIGDRLSDSFKAMLEDAEGDSEE